MDIIKKANQICHSGHKGPCCCGCNDTSKLSSKDKIISDMTLPRLPALLFRNLRPLTCVLMACAEVALTTPQITQTPYTLHSFLLCSHSEALVSRKAVKEFPVEAHCSLGLALYVYHGVLYIATGSHQCHVQIIGKTFK